MRVALVAGIALVLAASAEARERRPTTPDHGPDAAGVDAPDRAPVLLEIRRSRRGATTVRVHTADGEAPGSDSPEAFWIAFYNSVSEGLYPASSEGRERRRARRHRGARDALARLGQLCERQARELAGWNADDLAQRVAADEGQSAQLREVRATAEREAGSLSQSCREETPRSPVWKLELLLRRVQAMERAAGGIQEPLLQFVEALRPDQRDTLAAAAAASARPRDDADQKRAAMFCDILVPPDRVQQMVTTLARATRPQGRQAASFNVVMAAAARGQQLLHQSCTVERVGDPVKQLEVMRRRLQMAAEAIEPVHAALVGYGETLEARQWRSFSRLGFGLNGQANASR